MDGPTTGESRPRRPLLGVLAAVALGTWIGARTGAPAAAPVAAALVAAAVLAGTARRPGPAVLVLLAALAALRARGAEGSTAGAGGEDSVGRWAETGDGRGRLDGAARFALEPGTLRDGERALILFGRPPTPPAAGPASPAPDGDESGLDEPPREPLADEIVRLAPARDGAAARARRALARLRTAGLRRVSELEHPPARALVAALCFGDRSQLEAESADLFTRTGTRHALAVSGLHVGLVAALVLWPLGALLARLFGRLRLGAVGSLLGARELWRALLLALLVPLAGSGAPVARAALALALAQLAPRLPGGAARRADPLSLWALAALLECLAAPRSLFSLSLQLSYVATLGLIVGARGAIALLRAPLPGGGRIAPVGASGRPRPLFARVLAQKALDLALAAAGLSIAANVATLPLVWSRFGEWSAAGVVATPLILAPMALFLVAGWAWIALPTWPLEGALEALLALCARAMLATLELCDRLPGTPVPLPPRPLLLCAAAAAAALWALRGGRGARGARRAALVSGGILLLPWTRAARGLEVHALDVGSGTAVVVRAPGEPVWLFDAGSRDRPGVARRAVAPLLRAWDAGRVAVCLSHAERDHDGALGWIVERWPPVAWAGALPAHLAVRLPHGPARFDLEPGRARVAAPGTGASDLRLALLRGLDEESNEGSRALELAWCSARVLLCGDAEGEGLARLVRSGALDGPYDLLLVPHHGSDSDWLGRLLEHARPRAAWISTAFDPPAVDELERRGIPWASTARAGPLRWAAGDVPRAP